MLRKACMDGDLSKVKELLQLPDIDINQKEQNELGYTPLILACRSGNVEIVKLLLNQKRIDVNLESYSGTTPFLWACFHEKMDIVEVFLKNNQVDINKEDNCGCTPLIRASIWGKVEVVKRILASRRELVLHGVAIDLARERGLTEIVQLLEIFSMHPRTTTFELRKQMGFPGKYFQFSSFFLLNLNI